VSPLVSVLVVNYQAGPHLANCLRHLAKQTVRDFEAIVVDNASADGSLELAREVLGTDDRFTFIAAGANLGFAAGNNRAAAVARAPFLALLNPDAFAAPNWLESLLDAAERYPDAAMFGSTQLNAAEPTVLDGAGDHYFALGLPWRGGFGWPAAAIPNEGEVFGPCGAAALYRREAFDSVGGFDEKFFCYVEDVDLAFRLRARGYRCVQIPSAVVRHVGGGSVSTISGFAQYHGMRNMVWCFVKNMPGPLFWPLLPSHLLAVFAVALRAAIFRGPDSWRGLRDALGDLPWTSRRREQSLRKASWRRLAAAMTWSPRRYLTRAPFVLNDTPGTSGSSGVTPR
jgi:N-acetylglucosaminyl-diphospho-decaprenol L-rhamnosyltransferase